MRSCAAVLFLFSVFLVTAPVAQFSGALLIDRPANSWVAYPFTQMQTVTPTASEYPNIWGATGPAGIIGAWGGGAYDSKRDRLIIWGGGHNDYYGNELYVFSVDSLVWTRVTDPCPNPNLGGEVNPDGTPNSRHTYGGLAYIAHADRFFACGGALAYPPGSCGTNKVWTFNFDTNQWRDMRPSGTGPSTGCEDNCAYDPVGKKVWFFGVKSGMHSYDYDQNTWTKHNSDIRYAYSCVVDPKRHLLVSVGNGDVFVYDIGNNNYTAQTLSTTGGSAFIAKSHPGLAYDPVTDKIVGWHGGAVYALDMDTRVWTAYNAPLAPDQNSNGTFGRWRYCEKYNAFVNVNRIGDNVYFYKLTTGVAVHGGGNAVSGDLTVEALPNPFNPAVVISVHHGHVGATRRVAPTLAIFDIHGRMVHRVFMPASGKYTWNAAGLPPGLYCARINMGKRTLVKRLVLQK
jgi:hypothetical protein